MKKFSRQKKPVEQATRGQHMESFDLNSGNACENDVQAHRLLVLLGAHLSGFQELSDPEVFAVKSKLVNCAEDMQPNMVMTLEEELPKNAGEVVSVWAAVGKLPGGESIFWHRPLPCPEELAEFLYFHR